MKPDGFITKSKAWMAQGLRASGIVFCLFLIVTFAKTILFDYYAFHQGFFPTLGESTDKVFASLVCKFSISLLLASLTFLFNDKRWMILISFIIDIWCIANLIYMRNNNILLDGEAFNQAGNLHGYSASIFIYIEWYIDLLFLIMTALWSCIFIITDKSDRIVPLWLITLFLAVVLRLLGAGLNNSLGNNLLTRDGREYVFGWSFGNTIKQTSILESPLYVVADYIEMKSGNKPYHPLSQPTKVHIQPLINENNYHPTNEPLIIILVESFENWVCREDIMPNLYRLTQSDHVLYADNIHTQIVGAPSADGQMIVNTGLVPINAGATCLHYSHNTYPALMKTTDTRSVCLLSHDAAVWNQTEMSPAFGYDTTIICSDVDTILFAELNKLIDSGERYIQCVTQSTHAPFINDEISSLELPDDMPWVMRNYLRSFNAFDNGIKLFIDKLMSDSELQKYTIVITGDHRILHREKREQMLKYSEKKGFDYNPMSDALPLIVYSPRINGNIHYTADAYQMDIYPTVLDLIGMQDYMWRGVGANLLDTTTDNRYIKVGEVEGLCDRLIRNNYFAEVEKNMSAKAD